MHEVPSLLQAIVMSLSLVGGVALFAVLIAAIQLLSQ